MSTPASRSLTVVLRDALSGEAPLRLVLATCGAALTPPDSYAYVNVVINSVTVKVPRLSDARALPGAPAYLLAAPGFLLYLGTVQAATIPPP